MACSNQNLLLSSFYGINKSFTKKVYIGFGLDKSETEFEFVFRLCGNNFNFGYLALDYDGLQSLRSYFQKIDDYFCGKISEDNLIEENDFTIKFTRCYQEKAIEISYEDTQSDNNNKKSKVSLVLQKVSFIALKNIVNSMNYKFQLLHSKTDYLSMLQKKFISYLIDCLNESGKKIISQINAKDVRQICERFDEKVSENLQNQMNEEKKDTECNLSLEYAHLYLKELSVLHFNYLISTLNAAFE